MNKLPKILCVGVFLADRENTINHIVDVLGQSKTAEVEQRWIAISSHISKANFNFPVWEVTEPAPKCKLINRTLDGYENYDWIMIVDDDIYLPWGFVDSIISISSMADFALFQPARTQDSSIDHPIVMQSPGIIARRTRFVEIGPLVCMRSDAAKLLLPFADYCEMGWGLDFVWPVIMEENGLKLGIVDAVPIAHHLRLTASEYGYDKAKAEQICTTSVNRSLSEIEAFKVLEIYS